MVGYSSTDELVVLRDSTAAVQVFIGTGKDPMENLFRQTTEDRIPATGEYGLCAKRTDWIAELDGNMRLTKRTFALGGTKYFLDDKPISTVAARHFSFLQDAATTQLHVGRVDREIKFHGSLQEGSSITHVVITGVRDAYDWPKSAEIFIVASQPHLPIPPYRRLHVRERSVSGSGFVLVTELGVLACSIETRFMREPRSLYTWNNHSIKVGHIPSQYVIKNEEGFIY